MLRVALIVPTEALHSHDVRYWRLELTKPWGMPSRLTKPQARSG